MIQSILEWLNHPWIVVFFENVLKSLMVVIPVVIAVAFLTLAERRVIGFMQVRMGPNRVGPYGLFQAFADVFKLMFKEIVIPTNANRYLFTMAPLLALATALSAWSVIPFSDTDVIADIDAGLLFILALTSLSVYGVIIGGWASNSKYAFLGCLRSAAQIVSYEIAMGFALVGVVMVSGSLNLGKIVMVQAGGIHHWLWLPLFPLFLVYLISGVAETNRAPFDVAEGESEIVAGFHVEYSGILFAMFFLAEYANMMLIAILVAIMFLGGWLPVLEIWPFTLLSPIVWLLLKSMIVLYCFLWFRATFPRYRYDQIMRLGWKVFIPITIVWIVVLGSLRFLAPTWHEAIF